MAFDDGSPARLGLLLALAFATACARANGDVYDLDVTYVAVDGVAVDATDAATSPDLGADLGLPDAPAIDTPVEDRTPPVDLPPTDAGPIDAPSVDAGLRDSGAIDTNPVDTGPVDTGPVDTGPRDSGPPVDTGPRDSGPPVECAAGASRLCYTGPAATRGMGTCHDGVEQCISGRWSGRCDGQQLPVTEACNGFDDDCDGRGDSALSNTCYSGPAATQGVGACRGGTRTCSAGAWGACVGEVLPAAAESCGNGADDDCNGSAEDGCASASHFSQGNVHTCWLDDELHAWCWGGNFFGMTTYMTTAGSNAPVRTAAFDGVMLAAGEYFECVIRADRTLACAGLNDAGQIGDGTMTNRLAPVPVAGLAGVASVAAGYKHACAIVAGGAVQCWGLNDRQQLGTTCAGAACNARPLAVPGLVGVRQLALGEHHSCALMGDGTVTCWGDNANGQLGRGTAGDAVAPPAAVPGLSGVRAIEAGVEHTCALMNDGTVRCWGDNVVGQLGDGSTTDRTTPTAVIGLRGVERLVVGMQHGCVLTAGQVSCWGGGSFGQLGDGGTANRTAPVTAPVSGITDLGAGYWHTCARSTGTTMWCWGWNLSGMLGTGSATPSQSPMPLRVAF